MVRLAWHLAGRNRQLLAQLADEKARADQAEKRREIAEQRCNDEHLARVQMVHVARAQTDRAYRLDAMVHELARKYREAEQRLAVAEACLKVVEPDVKEKP